MPSPHRIQEPEADARRDMAYFIELRRNVLRYARTFPPGSERNQHRQIARSLRTLFRNRAWLNAHTLDGGCEKPVPPPERGSPPWRGRDAQNAKLEWP
jgi:hypothetical protein